MTLDNQTLALIAVGASFAANCRPCMEYHVGAALQCKVDGGKIAEAIEVGRRVKQGAASNMDRFAASLGQASDSSLAASEGGCGCGSLEKAQEVKNGQYKKTEPQV